MTIFNLVGQLPTPTITDGPIPAVVRFNLCGYGLMVGKDEQVYAGQKIALGDHPGIGDLHSPINGTIECIDGDEVVIRACADEQETRTPEPVDVGELVGQELRAALKDLGMDLENIREATTLVANCLNPEPGMVANQQILAEFRDTLLDGMKLAVKLVKPGKIFVALPQGDGEAEHGSFGIFRTVGIDPVYPGSVDGLVIATCKGEEDITDTTVLDAQVLLKLGEIARYGLPVTTTILTVGNANYRVRIGTSMQDVMTYAGVGAQSGDRVLLGGPMKGQPQFTLQTTIGKADYGLLVVPQGLFPPYTSRACLNCGECGMHCPARIPVGLMTRFCEFGNYDKAVEYDLDSCVECGLCAYHCPMRRPLLQFIRLARTELASRLELGTFGEASNE